MLNTVYRLVSPKRIEAGFTDINLENRDVLVRPTYLSICHADQRYYQGRRDGEILREKLPMALIHEAIGKVIHDPDGELKPGERVIFIPNQPIEKDSVIAENYLESSKFRASSCDGFMQEYVKLGRDRLLKVPEEISDESLFYLMSRGLTKQEAFLLMLEGIVRPFIDKLTDEEVKNQFEKKIETILKR